MMPTTWCLLEILCIPIPLTPTQSVPPPSGTCLRGVGHSEGGGRTIRTDGRTDAGLLQYPFGHSGRGVKNDKVVWCPLYPQNLYATEFWWSTVFMHNRYCDCVAMM